MVAGWGSLSFLFLFYIYIYNYIFLNLNLYFYLYRRLDTDEGFRVKVDIGAGKYRGRRKGRNGSVALPPALGFTEASYLSKPYRCLR